MIDSEIDSDCSITMIYTVENANKLIEEISDDFKFQRVLDLDPDMFNI